MDGAGTADLDTVNVVDVLDPQQGFWTVGGSLGELILALLA